MNDFKIGLKGRYQLVVSSEARGSRVVAEFDNIILNQGLDRIATGGCASHCHIGTGTTTPSASQTGLVSFSAATSDLITIADIQSYVPGATPYTELIRNYRFAMGVAVGTFAEVGIAWASSGSNLFSRALILDGGGSPTTITILSDETLDVKYIFRLYSPTTDVTGSVVIGGTTFNYTIRASEIDSASNGWSPATFLDQGIGPGLSAAAIKIFPASSTLGSTTGAPSGTFETNTTRTADTYTNGTYTRAIEGIWDLTKNPSGGVKTALFAFSSSSGAAAGCSMQMGFDAAIPKDNTKTLKLKASVTWARV